MSFEIRPLAPEDIDPLTRLWHDGWQEAHAAHVPAELTRLRTPDRFRERLVAFGDRARAAGPVGAPLGFAAIKGAEMDQIFVSPEARGTGLAAALLSDAEARLAACGVRHARLLCVVENIRAAAFYRRQGWTDAGVSREAVDTHEGPFAFEVLRFEKDLDADGP